MYAAFRRRASAPRRAFVRPREVTTVRHEAPAQVPDAAGDGLARDARPAAGAHRAADETQRAHDRPDLPHRIRDLRVLPLAAVVRRGRRRCAHTAGPSSPRSPRSPSTASTPPTGRRWTGCSTVSPSPATSPTSASSMPPQRVGRAPLTPRRSRTRRCPRRRRRARCRRRARPGRRPMICAASATSS